LQTSKINARERSAMRFTLTTIQLYIRKLDSSTINTLFGVIELSRVCSLHVSLLKHYLMSRRHNSHIKDKPYSSLSPLYVQSRVSLRSCVHAFRTRVFPDKMSLVAVSFTRHHFPATILLCTN